MKVVALVLSSVAALLLGLLALALLLGVGSVRQGTPMVVAVAAGLLVIVPAIGLAGGVRGRPFGVALAVCLWSLVVLMGFPLYFPGERAESLHAGLSLVMLPLGLEVPTTLSQEVDAALPAAHGVRPPPPARRLEPVVLPPPTLARADQVALPYEGEGRTLAVPVTIEGPGDNELEVWMMFDTGATLTTLDTATLAELGIRVLPDAPEVTVQTAAGPKQTRLALVDRVWVGGMEVNGVTVSVCDDCRGEHTRGLLGLNVSGRFLATVDPSRREILLEPHEGEEDRVLDIAHWVDLSATATRWPDGRVEVEVRLKNRAQRTIDWAEVSIQCSERFTAPMEDIVSGQEIKATVSLPTGVQCDQYKVGLERAGW